MTSMENGQIYEEDRRIANRANDISRIHVPLYHIAVNWMLETKNSKTLYV
jgi:hypothetical protein